MRCLNALLVMLLALSSLVPHHALAVSPVGMTVHVGVAHHATGHHAPVGDCGGGGAACIGCAVPDAPPTVVRHVAPGAVRVVSAFISQPLRVHATALDPPPPKAA